MNMRNYKKLAYMLVASFFLMYGVMFLNVDSWDHIYVSLTRLYMSLLMVSPMAILMILMMPSMYGNKKKNKWIISSSLAVFIVSFIFLRSQAFISDSQYMKAMIPHHSSAILTSKHAHFNDPETLKLAEDIIASQEREIADMKRMLEKGQ